MDEREQLLKQAGETLALARKQEHQARLACAMHATEATKVGMSQRRIAELLGVDRLTVRAWLGKQ